MTQINIVFLWGKRLKSATGFSIYDNKSLYTAHYYDTHNYVDYLRI